MQSPWVDPKIISFFFAFLQQYFRIINPNHYYEGVFTPSSKRRPIKDGYVEGFFQSEKYFLAIEDEVRKIFTFKKPLSKKTSEIKELIQHSNSVGVHVRRGDYLNIANNKIHGTLGEDYYKQAINLLESKFPNSVFFFFSDDMQRVKNTFHKENAQYVDWNQGEDAWQDMFLMSQCKHNIIANSSFSWRSARLNQNPQKVVIAPEKRFAIKSIKNKDILPKTWIKL